MKDRVLSPDEPPIFWLLNEQKALIRLDNNYLAQQCGSLEYKLD